MKHDSLSEELDTSSDSREDTLRKAIQKAVDGGWAALPIDTAEYWNEASKTRKAQITHNMIHMGSGVSSESYPIIIFNHDFAKALWDSKEIQRTACHIEHPIKRWQYHLQQMVISPDPIKYLGENI